MRYLLTDLEQENAMIEAEEEELREFYYDLYVQEFGSSIIDESQADELPLETVIEWLKGENFEIQLIG
ncbi:hypothetical protein [Halobacillus sp. H74]|uniref:hypothetical protein n=1 Tax=Halobacillus sp. H74 TaxID=3457436 RepID=UPI003FCE008D